MQKKVEHKYLLKKFAGKGGWTYAEIPEIKPSKNMPFGWVQVSGWIDDYKLDKIKLMPMGNGRLFLSVKAEIRKAINKQAGDWVHVVLELDESDVEIPPEIEACLKLESISLYNTFLNLSNSNRKAYIDWIYEAKTEQTKVKRILKMLDSLAKK